MFIASPFGDPILVEKLIVQYKDNKEIEYGQEFDHRSEKSNKMICISFRPIFGSWYHCLCISYILERMKSL